MNTRAWVLASLLISVAVPSLAASNLITNGSFESGTDPGSIGLLLHAGSTAIAGWLVSQENVDYTPTSYWQGADGSRTVDLNGSTGGAVSQTFPTTPGQTYLVNFALAGNPDGSPTIKQMRVAAAGQHADFSFDITGMSRSSMGWVYQSWSFTANASSTTIEFSSLISGAFGPVIDDVQLVIAPSQPSSDIEIFRDDFDGTALGSGWVTHANAGTISVNSGDVSVSSSGATFPYVCNASPMIPAGDFSLSFRLKYNTVTTRGTGLQLGAHLLTNGTDQCTQAGVPRFSIWQATGRGRIVFFWGFSDPCVLSVLALSTAVDLTWHDYTLTRVGNDFALFVDGVPCWCRTDADGGTSALNAWFGNPTNQGSNSAWTSFSMGYVSVLAPTFTIVASGNSGGTIVPSGNVSVASGQSQSFTITPDACHDIVGVTVDGVPQGPLTSYTFTNLSANHTIVANFSPSFQINSISFDKPYYTSGDVATLTVSLQGSRLNGPVQVSPVLTPHFGQAVSPDPVFVTLASDGSGTATFTWSIPVTHGQSLVDVTVTADAGGCGRRTRSLLNGTVVNELSAATISAAQQQLLACGTTTAQACASTPENLVAGIIPFFGTMYGGMGVVSDGCIAIHYWGTQRHTQSAIMWFGTIMDGIGEAISSVKDAACLTTGLPGCLLEPALGLVDVVPGVLSGAMTCIASDIDALPSEQTASTTRAQHVLADDSLMRWLPDSLQLAFSDARDTLADLAFCSGRARLKIAADSAFTTVDSVGLAGAVVVEVGAHAVQCASIRPQTARLIGNGTNPTNATTIRLIAIAADTCRFILFHTRSTGDVLKLTYAPIIFDAGGSASIDIAQDSTIFMLAVDQNGDGHADWHLYPGGAVVSVPLSNSSQGTGGARSLQIAPNPFFSSTRIYFEVASSSGTARLEVDDVAGRSVLNRDLGVLSAGTHATSWDGRGMDGRRLSPGVYFSRVLFKDGSSRPRRVVVLQ